MKDNGVLHTVDGVLYAGQHKVLKAWESFSGWYWFGVEKVEERRVGSPVSSGGSMVNGKEVDDVIWFGYVQGFECEWGYFSEAEIRSLGNLAWPIKPQDLPYAGRRS
jgi:hypothetical protein